ncbi:MAG: iron-sulfur cluster assembly scaffold protein [Candidatus Marinimicrobia bacterium]|nr:iron-sulfur cluster assembly scaffold protein [Candidatus Neomarinimicrobiota bacterium]
MSDTNWNYSDKVKEHFFNPKNVLKVSEEEYNADGVGENGSPVCGDLMRVYIKVKDNRIYDMKWKTFGCASAIGSTSMMSEMITENGGMKLDDAMEIKPDDIIKELGGLPANKIHCSVLGDKALRASIKDYYRKSGQAEKIKVEKDSRIVCECLNISEDEIKMEVLEGIKDFDTLQKRTKISTACGKCEPEARRLLDKYVKQYFETDIYTGE